MADEASQMKKELDLLKLEFSTMKNSIELLQSDPVLNNLPGGSLETPNLSTREHSPYWGPFRCEISTSGTRVEIGSGKVFFGNDLVHDFTRSGLFIGAWGASQTVWMGLECRITSDPLDMLSTATTVQPISTLTPTQQSGAYYIWLAKITVNAEFKATYLEQRWQGSDIYVPVWLYCGDTDGDSFDCEDGTKELDQHTCRRVAQLGSPACNPGNHNHVVDVGGTDYVTDCWCEGT